MAWGGGRNVILRHREGGEKIIVRAHVFFVPLQGLVSADPALQ